jgi:hypothetical protein
LPNQALQQRRPRFWLLGVHRLTARPPLLEKAIAIILKELEKNPPAKPLRSPYPVRVRKL